MISNMKKRILYTLLLAKLSSFSMVYSAYNPFKPDAIKVTNTAVVNVNVLGGAQFNNLNTTPVVNTDTDANVFLSVTSNGIFCASGTYLVDIVLYQTAASNDVSASVEITVNSVRTGRPGASGFIDNGGGHRESSTNVSEIISLSSTRKIGFDTIRMAGAGNITVPVGQSALRITRLKD
jgi:hypothetical protein